MKPRSKGESGLPKSETGETMTERALSKAASDDGQGQSGGSKTGMGITPPAQGKAASDDGQGQSGGSKTGMGVDGLMNAHALLIGVGRCEYSAWSLPVASRDARELRKILADPGLCAYPTDRIRILSDEAASRDGIAAALDELAEAASEDPDATVLVYYSGHGWRHATDDGERYFLIPYDVKPHELTSSALPAEDFIGGLRNLRSRRVLVMMDTCHASAMADAKDPLVKSIPKDFVDEPLPKALVEELGAGEGRAVFLSCGERQKSWILPREGSLSIFTHHLLAALQGAGSTAGDRLVKVSSLMRHLGEAVPESAARIDREQTPFFKFEAQDFPVALIRGGKGLPARGDEVQTEVERPAPSSSTIKIGNATAGRDMLVARDIGTLRTGSTGLESCGKAEER